jgi:CoA:oxalate CoA-transferase
LAAFPLAGLRVLDLSRVVSGPFAGRMLADLGADVVKLEPPDGDLSRIWGQTRHGLSGFYTQQNVGKRNVCIDLKSADGAALGLRLAAAADVVIENFRPGVLERLGLGWDTLHAANPRAVLLSISGFGQAGPESTRRAYAPVIHAEAGLIARQAAFDGDAPSDPMISIADYNGGLHGLVALLSALLMRDRTGVGQHIDVSMLDAMRVTDDYAHHALDHEPIVRLGGQVFAAAGGAILLTGEFKHIWRQLSRTHGLSDGLAAGASLDEKIAARRASVARWIAAFAERDALIGALDATNLAWADVRSHDDAFAGARVVEVDDRGGGTRPVIDSPYRFSGADSGIHGPAPYRGEHNADVLREWLDMPAADVAALTEAGALARE